MPKVSWGGAPPRVEDDLPRFGDDRASIDREVDRVRRECRHQEPNQLSATRRHDMRLEGDIPCRAYASSPARHVGEVVGKGVGLVVGVPDARSAYGPLWRSWGNDRAISIGVGVIWGDAWDMGWHVGTRVVFWATQESQDVIN